MKKNTIPDSERDREIKRAHHQRKIRQHASDRSAHYSRATQRMSNTYGYLLKSCYQEFVILLVAIFDLPLRAVERLLDHQVGLH